MIDPHLASALLGVLAACAISYVFGRLHGAAAALKSLGPIKPDAWPAALQGDLPNVPLVHGSES